MPSVLPFCSNCGNRNEADALFCESCGQRLEDAAAAPQAEVPAATALAPAQRRRLTPWLVVVGPVLLVGGLAVVFPGQFSLLVSSIAKAFGRGPSSEQPTATASGSDSVVVPLPLTTGTGPAILRVGGTPPAPPLGTRSSGSPTIALGSVLTLRAIERVCTHQNREGDAFGAVVERAVEGSNGARIPKGAVVTFVVDRLTNTEISISPESIEIGQTSYGIAATVNMVAFKEAGQDAGLPPMPPLPANIPPGAVVTRAVGGNTGYRCIEPHAPIRITLRDDLILRR